jgi:hypothetical protein
VLATVSTLASAIGHGRPTSGSSESRELVGDDLEQAATTKQAKATRSMARSRYNSRTNR